MRAVILDGPDSWSQNLVTEGIAELFIPIDFADAEAVFDRCCQAIEKAKKVRAFELTCLLADLQVAPGYASFSTAARLAGSAG